jgi:geranylgeranyl diphosphate synthase type II
MIHSYSLIHDDLPCMDDDDMRRGRPSNHRAFDEATAVLAGDGLLNRAFEVFLAPSSISAERTLAAMRYIAHASGIYGMIGGQMSDLLMEDKPSTGDMLRDMVALKTGAMIRAACAAGCILAGAEAEKLAAAERYAEYIGEAFQIRDDILDVIGDSDVFGKATGSDGRNEKTTFVSAYGIEACQDRVEKLTELAVKEAATFEDAGFITELAKWLADREH